MTNPETTPAIERGCYMTEEEAASAGLKITDLSGGALQVDALPTRLEHIARLAAAAWRHYRTDPRAEFESYLEMMSTEAAALMGLHRAIERQHVKLATLCIYIHNTGAGADLPDNVAEIMNEMSELVAASMSTGEPT